MNKDYLSLYLDKYAELKSKNIADQINFYEAGFTHCLVIPAYNENMDFIHRLLQNRLEKNGPLLVIVVINQPENVLDIEANSLLWEALQNHSLNTTTLNDALLLESPEDKFSLLAVDCFNGNKKLPAKQGVGLARKLGCDLAIALIRKQIIQTQWIHTSDADTILPQDYFLQTQAIKDVSAVHYNFQHCIKNKGQDSGLTEATLLYEKSLHYYVNGLRYAGSPYSFYTIGSCIAMDAHSYAQARGFPKRAGGEDFYLLNKLAKIGEVKVLQGEPITIESRLSNRAPFGTGPAVEKILTLANPEDDFHYYHPQAFEELKTLIEHFSQLFNYRENLQEWLSTLSSASQAALHDIQIEQLFIHLDKQAKTQVQFERFITQWFDAFKTLKFIHGLRNAYPDISLNIALGNKVLRE